MLIKLVIPAESKLHDILDCHSVECDLETRFRLKANRGSTEKESFILDQLKRDFGDYE
jgi:hypothetical protein